jgi:hypothetical protein
MGFEEGRLQNKRTFVLVLILATLLSFTAYKLFFWNSSVPSASAVEAEGSIGVYWDANCSQRVYSIDWGTLTLGETKEVIVYVRNEGNQTLILALTTLNWQPENAFVWVHFSWTCQTTEVGTGQIVKVTQNLNAAPNIPGGFSDISFDLIFKGMDHLLGDINKDGVVDMKDLTILAAAYGSNPADPR